MGRVRSTLHTAAQLSAHVCTRNLIESNLLAGMLLVFASWPVLIGFSEVVPDDAGAQGAGQTEARGG